MTELATTPLLRGHDGNTQNVALGRDYMKLARQYARGHRYTIRSVIECAIVHYLRAQGQELPEPAPPNRTKIEVSRNAGENWTLAGIVSKETKQGTVFVQADDGFTYQREADNCRGPFRWRWPNLEPVQ